MNKSCFRTILSPDLIFSVPAPNLCTLFLKVTQCHHIMYVVQVIIVDEFTGRTMPGRRWSDGLHQAVEAKEALEINAESITLASVSYQAFFRWATCASDSGCPCDVRDAACVSNSRVSSPECKLGYKDLADTSLPLAVAERRGRSTLQAS